MENARNGISSGPPGGPLILIADPSAAARETIAAALANGGYRTLATESGSAALMMVRSEHPSLLLVDQDTPGLSGIDLLRELRGAQGSAAIPVIIMTASKSGQSAVAALGASADDHIVKPFEAAVICARIERQLERSRETAALKQAAAALDARLTRRALEIEELQTRIETLAAEKAALGVLLASQDDPKRDRPVKSIAAR